MISQNNEPTHFTTCFRGFSLIEVLIAMAILSIGILGVAALQIHSIGSTTAAGNLTERLDLAVDRMEKLTSLSYNHPSLSPGEHSFEAGNLELDNQNNLGDGLDNDRDGIIDEPGETGANRIAWQIRDNQPVINTKTIIITVRSRSAKGMKQYSLSQVITK